MENDERNYQRYLEMSQHQHDEQCRRCGVCCGATDGDPCVQLVQDAGHHRYYCKVYEHRLGPQVTVSGKRFTCVTIHDRISAHALPEGCAYQAPR